ncbi:unnamed protein product [Meloidogyne enterolobii]|uniref:Uncharacterized protein n=1 Tax=Meloidogyne enterolobii TaxID=390850 RepID=A0ACB0YML4_MELEN
MEYYEGQHKDRSLSDCMLLVAQRLTKYPVLVEQIHPKDRIDFSFDNLFWPVKNDSTITLTNSTKTIGRRQILLITRAFWRETMNGPELERKTEKFFFLKMSFLKFVYYFVMILLSS